MRNEEKQREEFREELNTHIEKQISVFGDFDIAWASMLGISIMLSICIAFNIKITILGVLIGILIGGLLQAYTRKLIIDHSIKELEFRAMIDSVIGRGIDANSKKIKILEEKIETLEKELQKGRH